MAEQPTMATPLAAGEADIIARLKAADDRATAPESSEPLRAELNAEVRRGFSQAFVITIGRALATRLPGGPTPVSALVSITVAAAWPYAVNLAVAGWAPGLTYHSAPARTFALGTTLVSAAMLAFAWTAWRSALDLTAPLADLLRASPECRTLSPWLRARLHPIPQAAAGAAGIALALGLLLAGAHQKGAPIHASAGMCLVQAWAGFLGGNVVYWLYTAAELPMRLRRCTRLQLAWIDPAHTPSIVRLCRIYTFVAGSSALGVIVTELSAVYVSGEHPSKTLHGFFWGFLAFAVITALYVGAQPFVTLAALVRSHIDHIIDPLMAQMTHPPAELLRHKELDDLFKVYTRYRSLKLLPIRTGAVLQYVSGILASLIVFVVQQGVTK